MRNELPSNYDDPWWTSEPVVNAATTTILAAGLLEVTYLSYRIGFVVFGKAQDLITQFIG